MNWILQHLNTWGAAAVAWAWPMFWQSSILFTLLWLFDWVLGKRLRPAVRYALWLLVLVKLVLPPSLACPTGLGWWIRPHADSASPAPLKPVVVTYGTFVRSASPQDSFDPEPASASLTSPGAALAMSVLASCSMLAFVVRRWRQMARLAASAPRDASNAALSDMLQEARASTGVRRRVTARVVASQVSPALFGVFRPAILLPESIWQRLSPTQLKAVLTHELIHLRRGDLWVNCAQTLLQILYWWHPLVWIANQRIRQAREEAVDEAVMVAMGREAESYAPTLLEVARLILPRPSNALGLVGILESPAALRQRIERLIRFHPPRRTSVVASLLCAVTFGALALPMGGAPEHQQVSPSARAIEAPTSKPEDVNALVRDGRLLCEMGKLDQAEKKFEEALRLDPRAPVAYSRLRICHSLNSERLSYVQFRGITLDLVVRILSEESRRADPAGKGVNFIFNALPAATNEPPDFGRVTIRLEKPLVDVRLADALDAIIKTADKPIQYSIEDYAVVFSLKHDSPLPLYVRVFNVDSDSLYAALRATSREQTPPESRSTESAQKLLRSFLESMALDLSPPKSIFWNERAGTIMVRATLQDLDTIENVIQVLSPPPRQVTVSVKFLELPEAAAAAFWDRHPQPSQVSSPVLITALPQEEAQAQLSEWKTSGDAELIAQPRVTTLSGRQTQVQVTDLKTVVTFTNTPTPHWETNQVPFGPTVELLPTVSADTLRIDLAVTAWMTEFLGYERWQDQPIPLPHFRLRELPATATVWDTQTLVIGGHPGGTEDSTKPNSAKKQLLVMITPTLIDYAGNRVHTDQEIESAQSRNKGLLQTPILHPTIPPRRAN